MKNEIRKELSRRLSECEYWVPEKKRDQIEYSQCMVSLFESYKFAKDSGYRRCSHYFKDQYDLFKKNFKKHFGKNSDLDL